MRRECKIKIYEDSGISIIEILGDLTASAQKEMDTAMQKACDHNPSSIMIKFNDKSRINSSGIAILINLVIDSREKGCEVYVTGMSDHFRKIFGMVGLTRYADIVESVDEIQTEEAD